LAHQFIQLFEQSIINLLPRDVLQPASNAWIGVLYSAEEITTCLCNQSTLHLTMDTQLMIWLFNSSTMGWWHKPGFFLALLQFYCRTCFACWTFWCSIYSPLKSHKNQCEWAFVQQQRATTKEQ
jgi:hypothetical protein